MLVLKRTDNNDKDFHLLVEQLNQDLLDRYGELQLRYNRFNQIDNIPNVVVAYENENRLGCACFKKFDEQSAEVKRMFVRTEARGKGIGAAILTELEQWAAELGYTAMVLEHGFKQPEASILYERLGYTIIPNYGEYIGLEETSICRKKMISLG